MYVCVCALACAKVCVREYRCVCVCMCVCVWTRAPAHLCEYVSACKSMFSVHILFMCMYTVHCIHQQKGI